jgi:Xaa-Pro aminopeptidase
MADDAPTGLTALLRDLGLADAVVGVDRDGMAPRTVANLAQAGRGLTGTFPTGHGIGLEVRGYPIVVPDTGLRIADDTVGVPADVLLEEGMVVNLEVTQFIPGVGSLEVEVTTLVTGSGARPSSLRNAASRWPPISRSRDSAKGGAI